MRSRIAFVILILVLYVENVKAFGFPLNQWMVDIILEGEESITPWVGTVFFIQSFGGLYVLCYFQAYIWYRQFGGDLMMDRCLNTIYDSFKTAWKT